MFMQSADGEYQPSFFIIRIDSDQPIETVLEENESTFIHEYIHFLQDLILPYCMRENLVRLRAFFRQIEHARELGEIHLPSEISDTDVALLTLQSKFTWGADDIRDDVGAIQLVEVSGEWIEEHQFTVNKYEITLENGPKYHFGARDLLEYIACKIESRHFPSEQKLPDLPYHSVDLLINHYELSHLSDTKRVALAEYCLLNDNPAQRLIVLIQDIKNGQFGRVELQDDEPFIEVLRNLPWKAAGRPFETINEKLDRRYADLKVFMLGRFPQEAFPAIYDWLNDVMKYARQVLAGRSLFANLFAMDNEAFQLAIRLILRDIGVPLVVNRKGELGTSLGGEGSKDQFVQLLLAYEFSDYVTRTNLLCPLYGTCEHDRPAIMDENCMNAPFRNAHKDELCPFGAFAKAHGLAKVSWYVNGRLVPSRGSDLG